MEQFRIYLKEKELSPATIEKYVHDVSAFQKWAEEEDAAFTKEKLCGWKDYLLSQNYAAATINAALAAMNAYADFMQKPEYRLKYVRSQRSNFIKAERQLTKAEYEKLIHTARSEGRERLAMIMETIGSTGMRISELRYVTVESLSCGSLHIRLKGKDRLILLPNRLCKKLKKYIKQNKILSGIIFKTRCGTTIGRKQIWAEMKRLCETAGVEADKVFPHNLRHLFARMFFKVSGNIAELADVLGHSSIETTRIYLRETVQEHRRKLEKLRLIC